MQDELIPIVMFLVIGGVFWLLAHYRQKTHAETQQTIRLALEKGEGADPALLERLLEPKEDGSRDLRRGAVWIAAGVGLALCGVAVPDPSGDALRGCLAGAAFPFSIGVAYVLLWRLGLRNKRS